MILLINETEYPVSYANTVVNYTDSIPQFNFYVAIPDGAANYESIAYELMNPANMKLVTNNNVEYTFEGFTPESFVQNYGDDMIDVQIHMVKPFDSQHDSKLQRDLNYTPVEEVVDADAEPVEVQYTDEEMKGPEA